METPGDELPSLGGGGVVLPSTLPLSPTNLTSASEQKFDEDLPPLVPLEEADLPQLRASSEGETQATSSLKPPRQLRNRNVARSVITDRKVQFSSLVDCIDGDHRYQEPKSLIRKEPCFHLISIREISITCHENGWELLHDPTPSRALQKN